MQKSPRAASSFVEETSSSVRCMNIFAVFLSGGELAFGAVWLDISGKSRENLSDAASSSRRNIAEGFGRRGHKEFARFLNISLSSLKEVEDGLIECVDNEWVTETEIAEALTLCKRATVATTRLRNSIKDKPDPPWCM